MTAISTGRPFPSFPTLTKMTRGCQGIMAIVAATGVGKSLLAQHLAADLAGEDFPGVYCDFENLDQDVLRRFTLVHGPEHPGLYSLVLHNDYARAVEWLQLSKTGFLVLDTLTSSVGVVDGDLGDRSAAIANRMAELNELAKAGYAVIVVVQAGRSTYDTGQCPPMRSAQYSSAIEQYASTVLGVWRNRAGDRFVRPIKNRFPVDATYQQGSLQLQADGAERLQEGLLVVGDRSVSDARPAGLTPVAKVLQKRGRMAYVDLRDSVRRLTKTSLRHAERMIRADRAAGRVTVGDDKLYGLPGAA